MRGDAAIFDWVKLKVAGSPPRAWGRSRIALLKQTTIRFTPTCVGTLQHPVSTGAGQPVHPHVRGDADGLSVGKNIAKGFTPTCVGTLSAAAASSFSVTGSPPRAWGR